MTGLLQGGNRVRVNAQLISAETGAHLWADQFDISTANARARRVTIATIDGVTH
jgi:TolB-like protein